MTTPAQHTTTLPLVNDPAPPAHERDLAIFVQARADFQSAVSSLVDLQNAEDVQELCRRARLSPANLARLIAGEMVPSTFVDNLSQCLDLSPGQRHDLKGMWSRMAKFRRALPETSVMDISDPFEDVVRRLNLVNGATEWSVSASDVFRHREDVPGFQLKPDPLTALTKEELLRVMREFHVWAGEPSYREIALRSGKMVGASTLCEALNPRKAPRLPSLKVITAFIHGCGGTDDDLTLWTTAWRRVRMGKNTNRTTVPLSVISQRQAG